MTHGSLFTGMGGFDLGAEWSGIPTIWACEIEPFNRDFIRNRFTDTTIYNDIKIIESTSPVDIISGGFPCQDISIASSNGRAGLSGNKSGLFWEMLRVVKLSMPRYVIIENSPALKHKGLDTILREFASIGYDAEWQTLSGHQFGLAQRRKRLYIILYSPRIGDGMEKGQIFARWDKPEYPAWRDTEPKVYGVADVIPNRVDKHRSLGNAVQPVIAHYLFECIKLHHHGRQAIS